MSVLRAPSRNVTVGFTAQRSRSTPSRKLPLFSTIAFSRHAAPAPTTSPTSTLARYWSQLPTVSEASRTGPKSGCFVTRLITPPAPPRPKIIPAVPFSTSTRSRL